jgi:hypothetical protein
MKQFKEFVNEVMVNTTKARSGASEAFRSMNSDRIGQPILNVRGKEVNNTIVLSPSSFAQKQGRGWRITSYELDGTVSTVEISQEELRLLK